MPPSDVGMRLRRRTITGKTTFHFFDGVVGSDKVSPTMLAGEVLQSTRHAHGGSEAGQSDDRAVGDGAEEIDYGSQ